MHAEGHIHEVAYEKMQYGVAAQGPGTTGKRVVRRGVRARLPGKSTWGRVSIRVWLRRSVATAGNAGYKPLQNHQT